MNRNIITQKKGDDLPEVSVHHFDTPSNPPATVPTQQDNYSSRLVKYVPTEVIATYMLLVNIVQLEPNSTYYHYYAWGILVFGLIGTYIWLNNNQKVVNRAQLILSCIAFVAWAISIAEPPFAIPGTLRALIAPCITFLIAAYKPEPLASQLR